jgi:hypothetical protein
MHLNHLLEFEISAAAQSQMTARDRSFAMEARFDEKVYPLNVETSRESTQTNDAGQRGVSMQAENVWTKKVSLYF